MSGQAKERVVEEENKTYIVSSYVNSLDKTKPELASTGHESTDTVQAILYLYIN